MRGKGGGEKDKMTRIEAKGRKERRGEIAGEKSGRSGISKNLSANGGRMVTRHSIANNEHGAQHLHFLYSWEKRQVAQRVTGWLSRAVKIGYCRVWHISQEEIAITSLYIYSLFTDRLNFEIAFQTGTMKCFQFSNGEGKQNPPMKKSASGLSSSTTSTDHEMKKSGSELNSRNVSSLSSESVERPPFPSLSQKPNNLRKFTFEELKVATRNFSRSLMLGEGGFGCVYRGIVKGHEDPYATIEIAVKQLSRKGLQARLL
ncbi:hypothetical protein IEQ34_001803 [Dendrobium chrysotoxum]|uniref:Uncharacterized protein n=1 Tax=Dendrobium chrysotoxum TaxID=161865 RepID=A0AAV7HQ15_DENCH|nr:hypothetical protein IEQ34_001803 [Dendrobium chrysotoxum]